jgi:hypothetical protein
MPPRALHCGKRSWVYSVISIGCLTNPYAHKSYGNAKKNDYCFTIAYLRTMVRRQLAYCARDRANMSRMRVTIAP